MQQRQPWRPWQQRQLCNSLAPLAAAPTAIPWHLWQQRHLQTRISAPRGSSVRSGDRSRPPHLLGWGCVRRGPCRAVQGAPRRVDGPSGLGPGTRRLSVLRRRRPSALRRAAGAAPVSAGRAESTKTGRIRESGHGSADASAVSGASPLRGKVISFARRGGAEPPLPAYREETKTQLETTHPHPATQCYGRNFRHALDGVTRLASQPQLWLYLRAATCGARRQTDLVRRVIPVLCAHANVLGGTRGMMNGRLQISWECRRSHSSSIRKNSTVELSSSQRRSTSSRVL